MTDLVQPLAAHAADFPSNRLDASVRDHLALDLVDGLGHPTNPVSREQTGNKLRDCNAFAGAPLSEQGVEAVLSAALGIANLRSTTALTSLLRV